MTPDDRAQLPLRAELREWCVGRPHEDAPVSKGELLSLLDVLDAAVATVERVRALAADWQANGNSRELADPTATTWHDAAQQLLRALDGGQ